MDFTEEERARIGRAVETERIDLGWGKEEAARQAKINSITWKRVEDGLRVQPVKMRRVEATLGWGIGSMDQVARGREPVRDAKAAHAVWGQLEDEDELWRGVREATAFAEVCRRRGANDEMCRYFIADAIALLNSAASHGATPAARPNREAEPSTASDPSSSNEAGARGKRVKELADRAEQELLDKARQP